MPALALFLQDTTEVGPVEMPWLWIVIALLFTVAIIYLVQRIGPG